MRYILFDLDGTLTDPKVGITTCVQYALRKFGIDEPDIDRLTWFIGPPLVDSFKAGYGFDDEKAASAVAAYRERFSTVGLFENDVYDGVSAMLDALRAAGFVTAIATSKPTVFTTRILDHFGLTDKFDAVVGSELDGTRNAKAEVIREVMGQLGITDPADAVMVGDRRQDIAGAAACDMRAIGVRYGYAEPNELEAAGAWRIADSVADLQKVLLKLR